MRLRVLHLACLVSCVALPALAHAQAEQGDKEILFFANIQSIHSPDSTISIGTVFANLGYFLTDRMEVGGGPQFSVFTSGGSAFDEDAGDDGGSTTVTTGMNGFFRLYLGDTLATVKPYVGAEYSVTDFAHAVDSQFLGATGGVKNYFNENTALDVKATYGFRPNAPGDFQLLNISIGLTFAF